MLSVSFFYRQYSFSIIKNDIRQVFYRQGFKNFSFNVSLLFFFFNMKNLYLECKNSRTIAESIFQVTIELLAGVFIKSMPSGISLLCKQN